MLPWVFIGMDIIQGGSVIPGLIGIVVGHTFHFLENIYPSTHGGSKLFITPGFVKDAFDPLDPREMTSNSQGYSSQQGRSTAQPTETNLKFGGKGYRLGS